MVHGSTGVKAQSVCLGANNRAVLKKQGRVYERIAVLVCVRVLPLISHVWLSLFASVKEEMPARK